MLEFLKSMFYNMVTVIAVSLSYCRRQGNLIGSRRSIAKITIERGNVATELTYADGHSERPVVSFHPFGGSRQGRWRDSFL